VTGTTAPEPPGAGLSLAARFFGILFSPRATYADVVARPRTAGMMILVLLISAAGQFTLFSTERGQRAMQASFDEGIREQRAQGNEVPPESVEAMRRFASIVGYVSAVGQLVFGPLIFLLIAAIVRFVCNAFLDSEASFPQALAVVTHSGVVTAVGGLFMFTMQYVNGNMNSPTNLIVFFPMLETGGFLDYLIRTVDLLYVWSFINLAIGLGVLYRRRTGAVAATLLGLYAMVGLLIATVRAL
jgi:hypothetical protein